MIQKRLSKTKKHKKPFRGKPVTIFREDRTGDLTITVYPRALHPITLFCIRWFSLGMAVAALALGGYTLMIDPYPTWAEALGMLIISCLTYPFLRFGLAMVLQWQAPVRFSKDRISIRRFLFWKHFERRHPHSFTLFEHDKSQDERDKLAFRNNKSPRRFWFLRRRAYFGESYHVCLDYFGERQDIITVHGIKKARKIHARLMACDEVIEGHTHGDGGVVLSPETDWSTAVGTV